MTEAIAAVGAASELTVSPTQATKEPSGDIDFLAVLEQIDAATKTATEQLAAVAGGDDTVPLHELMISLESARLQLQLAVEVRNRLVEGYQELSRMQV